MSKIIDLNDFNVLFLKSDIRDQIRLCSLKQRHANDWLRYDSYSDYGNYFSNDQFRLLMRLRFGLKISNGGCAHCKKFLDDFGDHALTCKVGGATV